VEVDLARNLAMDAAVIAPGGTIAVYAATTEPTVPPPALMRQNASIGFVLVYTIPDAAKRSAIDDLTNALTAGALTPLPAVRFPLARIADAHDAVAGGAIGKVLVDVWPGPGYGPGETTS
jgi:NADPH2:quinone reductase